MGELAEALVVKKWISLGRWEKEAGNGQAEWFWDAKLEMREGGAVRQGRGK